MHVERISHGHGQMRAQSISIQVSDRRVCNSGCLFCISRVTPRSPRGQNVKRIEESRLRVGLNYARTLGATHAILTSKSDPMQEELPYLCGLVATAREFVPLVDMHTNGRALLDREDPAGAIGELARAGLTMLTFSIASFDDPVNERTMNQPESAAGLIAMAAGLGLLVRCSLVLSRSSVSTVEGMIDYVVESGRRGAHMVVVRELWTPEAAASANEPTQRFSVENKIDIGPVLAQFRERVGDGMVRERDPLPWGAPVFTVTSPEFADRDSAVNVTFARCEEATAGAVLKSIVHRPDGHGYRNWDDRGDILY